MALSIPTDQPFRFQSELRALVAAVLAAEDHDETLWLEWKGGTDLASKETAWHIARQILGFANRDVSVAARWAGGFAYLVVGATPQSLSGVTPVDPAVLDQAVRRFVGSEPRWHAEDVEFEGKKVLVVAVDPPKLGDPVFAMQKAYGPTQAGTVLIRRPGKTEQANPAELRMLIEREKAAQARLDLDLVVVRTPLERIMNPTAVVEEWLEGQRQKLKAAGVKKEAQESPSTGESTPAFDQVSRLTAAFDQVGAVSALLGSAANRWTDVYSEPDPRTPEDYQREVEEYLDNCRKALLERFVWRTVHRPEHHLELELVNTTLKNFLGLKVVVHLEGEVRIFGDDDLDLAHCDEPALPKRPLPLGTRRQKNMFGLSGLPDEALRSILYTRGVRSWPIEPQDPPYRAHNTGSVTIKYRPLDLRPKDRIKLEPVPLIIPSQNEDITVIEGTWTATARNVDDHKEGTLRIDVVESSFEVQRLFT